MKRWWQTETDVWWWTAVLVLALLAAWPAVAEPGLLNTRGGGDSPFLLQRLHQLETAVVQGHFPVRWMPDAAYGHGYPFYNYYAPLSIYIAAFFRLLGFSFVSAIHLAQVAGFVVAAGGMFVLARRWWGTPWAGLLAAVAYTAAPFHMVNVYVRGDSLAEFWAMAFYPLVILTADTLLHSQQSGRPRRGPVALFALAYAALILSHNISALIFSPFLLLFVALRWLMRHQQQAAPPLRTVAAAFLLAFSLSAWFFLPALAEQSLGQLGSVTTGYFHFSNHFLGSEALPLVQRTLFFDYAVEQRQAFSMGLVQALAGLAGVVALLLVRRQTAVPRAFILVGVLLSTLMLLPLSAILWRQLPLLAFTQFPWRFLSVQAFFLALATAALAWLPVRRWLTPLVAVALLLAALGNLQTDHLPLTDADVTGERLAQYEWFTGNMGTTVSYEYLPNTVQPRPYTSGWLDEGARHAVQVLSGDVPTAVRQNSSDLRQQWRISATSDSTLVFPTYYWPGWQARLNDQPVAVAAAPGSGQMMVIVPPGDHTITLWLGLTPVRQLAELISLTAVVWMGLFLLTASWGRWWRWLVGAAVGVLLLALLGQLERERPLSSDTLTWDFAQMAYLHHDEAGTPFTNGLTLRRYEFAAEEATAGATWRVTTYWEGDGTATPADATSVGATAVLTLVNPARNWIENPTPPVIAEMQQPIVNGTAVFDLPIPANAPAGLLLPRLTLADGAVALTPSGQTRGDLYLRPLRVQAGITELVAAGRPLDVQAVAVVARPDQSALDVQLAWWTAQPLTHNYNVSLRLTDAYGRFLRVQDGQPGYGFRPSSGWPAGEWVHDWLAVGLPEAAEEHAWPYGLVVQLYDVTAPQTAVLTRRLGEVASDASGTLHFIPNTPAYTLPANMEPAAAQFGEQIGLRGYTISQDAESLLLSLVWQADSPIAANWTRFVHLVAAADQPPLVADDSMPRNNSYPTTQWVVDEVVLDAVQLDLQTLPPGEYQLAVGFYELLGDGVTVGVTAVDGAGSVQANGRYVLPVSITIPEN